MRHRGFIVPALVIVGFLFAAPLYAASSVVPPDGEMIRRADAVVVATAMHSRTELRDKAIETVTIFSIEEVLKGPIGRDSIDVYEPGGAYENRITTIPGVPRFQDGERYLLFLTRPAGLWRVLGLGLGKFTFETDAFGHDVLLRDTRETLALDPDGKLHREQNRAADPFLDFIRLTAKGAPANDDYQIPAEAIIAAPDLVFAQKHAIVPLCTSGCTPTSYTYDYSGTTGARWNAFPVSYFSTGANSAAITAMNNALASWTNDASSNVTLLNAGADMSGMHTGGVAMADNQNTVAFEKDLHTEYGAMQFTCTSSSYGGTLGVAAITSDTGTTHVGPNGETFFTAKEGDVEMNQGLSTCTFFISLGDFNSAVTHELGHTIGFRHSDEARNLLPGPASACSSDPSLECSSSAIMKAFIPSGLNGALQAWDQHAIDTVYPGSPPAAVTSVVATATSPTNVQVTWSGSCSTTCHIYRSADHITYALLNPSTTVTTSPYNDTTAASGSAYLYKVRAFNGNKSADSNIDLATTVIYTNTIVVGGTIQAVDTNEMRNAIDAVRTLDGIGAGSYTFGSGSPVRVTSGETIYATDMNEMRTNLDTAYFGIFGSHPTYTNTMSGGGSVTVKALDFNEVRNWMR